MGNDRSLLAKSREESPLKGLWKYLTSTPNMVSLAGGLPHPSLFPFETISAISPKADFYPLNSSSQPSSLTRVSWFWKLLGYKDNVPNKNQLEFTIKKWNDSDDPLNVNLATALQYGTAEGLPALKEFMHQFSQIVYQPALPNFATLIDVGATDGWSKCVLTFCERGQCVLVEEFTYPSALACLIPLGCTTAPIKMDGQGMRADDLEKVLSEWNEEERGAPRPHFVSPFPFKPLKVSEI